MASRRLAGKTVTAANDGQADAFVEAVGSFGRKIFLKNLENGGDFGKRAAPSLRKRARTA